ncbi:transcription initiation factor IIB-like [Durio zibethinus]|uniref:Transcription initiation factor IIB-like n=1 Tax=Durio zibethinus TaxID=66656 RepID=A0A6P5YMV2_DURZI|nr:transcription initiation factor IIB-like [Durio zibethinus]
MATNFCLDCQRQTEIILDYRAGYKICSECGLVLGFNHINEIPEQRNFPDSIQNRDQNRVGSKENPVFKTEDLSTYTSKPTNRIIKRPKKGLKLIGEMTDRLGLVSAIKDRACEIYNKVDVLKSCRGRSTNSILAACLFIACREIRLFRTLKEISTVAGGVSKKNINRAIVAIKKQLEVETKTVQPGELVRRFCSKLGMENQAIKAVQEAVKRTEELDIRRSPTSVLAAIVYMVLQLSHDQVPLPVKDIAMATGVTEPTIRKSYKDIFPYALRVIPDWYAGEEQIHKLQSLKVLGARNNLHMN